MYTFPEGIGAMRNANSLVQDLISGQRIYFFRRHEQLFYLYRERKDYFAVTDIFLIP